jgi:dienelactone hydrolase
MKRFALMRRPAFAVVAGFAFLVAPPAKAQEKTPSPADEAMHKYLAAQTDKLSQKYLDGAKTLEEWKEKRPRLEREYLDMLGLWPLPEKTPLKATVTGQVEAHGVIVEKLHYQSKPGLYVTANLYRPKTDGASPADAQKLPAVLYVCGHSNKGRDGNKTAFQDHGFWFANNGYVCLMVDTLQLGEIPGVHHGTYGRPWNHLKAYGINPPVPPLPKGGPTDVPPLEKGGPGGVENRWWWHAAGYTPAGVECWNGVRGIDYLLTRPEVDPERIGVTGISGGGATTVWIAAADDRVKVAVPVSGMSDLESYVTNKVINGHCDCMFFINTYQWEWTTALALHAPKPLLFANSDNDKIFPMDGNRRIIERMRKCYDMLGHKENVEEYVSKGGHDYRPDMRVAIFQFINKHLKQETKPVKDADFPKIEGKDLRVFPEDKDLPKDQINDRVDEVFVPVADVKLPAKAEEFKEWKAGLVKKLRATSFRALPEKVADIKSVRPMNGGSDEINADDGIQFFGTPVNVSTDSDRKTVIVLNPEDKLTEFARQFSAHYEKDGWVYAIAPRGAAWPWTRKNPPNTVERSLALLGQTVDSGRVRDAAAFVAPWAKEKKREPLRILGRGQAGVIATYAALMWPGMVDEVLILDPPASHRDGPQFLNVDRVVDLPTALGLLAPDVKLTLLGAKDRAFDKTAAIYKLAGAGEKFVRK